MDTDLRKVFKVEKTLLTITGFYPAQKSSYKSLFMINRLICLIVSWTQLLTMLIILYIDIDNLNNTSNNLLFCMTQIALIWKISNLLKNGNRLMALEEMLTSPFFYEFSKEQFKIIEDKARFINVLGHVFRVLAGTVVLFYGIYPYLDSSSGNVLSLPGWFPYNTTTYRHQTIAFQTITVFISAYNNTSIDILTGALITIACAELEVFMENLSKFVYYTRRNGNRDNGTEAMRAWKKNIVLHNKLLWFCSEIEDTFSNGILVQFLASVVIICFTGFQFLVVPLLSAQMVLLVCYFACMIIQVIVYCWFGNELITTSSKLGGAFFTSNWYEANLDVRKMMIIFLEASKRPIRMTAAGMFGLTLVTLTMILRSAYSYFAVLRRVYLRISID